MLTSKVLIVEDNLLFRKLLHNLLQIRFPGMQIAEAEDGLMVLKKIKDQLPDLILMDIRLCGVNGFELTQEIKKYYAVIPLIIMSNYSLPEYRQAAAQAGADYFIPKDEFLLGENMAFIESMLI